MHLLNVILLFFGLVDLPADFGIDERNRYPVYETSLVNLYHHQSQYAQGRL